MISNPQISKYIFFVLAALSLMPFVSPPLALLAGIVFVNFIGSPHEKTGSFTKKILQYSIIGLGFGINYREAVSAGSTGFIFTVSTIAVVMALGILLGKIFRIDKNISKLISVGTAICGGSAIAAVSPILKANNQQNSVALGTVFILNAVALFTFPAIGHLLHLSQTQFGIWSAIAIHDTSSVVGAASRFGQEALNVATTVKLARALWIIPVALLFSLFTKSEGKIKIPYFIGGFVVAILLNSFIPFVGEFAPYVSDFSRAMLKVALFLIGTGLSFKTFKIIGFKPLIAGVILWFFISAVSLWAVIETVHA